MAQEKPSRKKRQTKVPRSYLWKTAENATQKTSTTNKLADLSFSSKLSEFVFCNRGYGSIAFYAVILLFIIAFIYTLWKIVSSHSSRTSRRPGSNGIIKITPTTHAHIGTLKSDNGNEINGVTEKFHQTIQQIPHQFKDQNSPRHKSFNKNVPSERTRSQTEYLGNQFNPVQYNGYQPAENNQGIATINQPNSYLQPPPRQNVPVTTAATFHPWGPLVGEDPIATEAPALTSPVAPTFNTNMYRAVRPTRFYPYGMSPTRRYPYRSAIWNNYANTYTWKPSSYFNNEERFPSRGQASLTTLVGEDPYSPSVKATTARQKFYKEIKYFGSEDPFSSPTLHPVKRVKSNDLKSFMKVHQNYKSSKHYNYEYHKSGRSKAHSKHVSGRRHKSMHMSDSEKQYHAEKHQKSFVYRKSKHMHINSLKRSRIKHQGYRSKSDHYWQHKPRHHEQKQTKTNRVQKLSHKSVSFHHHHNHHHHHNQHHHHHRHRHVHQHHKTYRKHRKHHNSLHHPHHNQHHLRHHAHQSQRHHQHSHHSNHHVTKLSHILIRRFSRLLRHPVIDYKHYQHFRRHHSVNDEIKGRWHSSKHRIKSCKTIRRFRSSGTVKVSKSLYRGNGKHLYTILACGRFGLRLRRSVHGHKHKYSVKYAQLCRKSWYVTNSLLQVKKESKKEEGSNHSYRIIICNPSFAPKLKLSNFKEVSFVSNAQIEKKKHKLKKHNHLKKISRTHHKRVKKTEISHVKKHKNAHVHSKRKRKHAHERKKAGSHKHKHKRKHLKNKSNKKENRRTQQLRRKKKKRGHSKKNKNKSHKVKSKKQTKSEHGVSNTGKKKKEKGFNIDKSFFSKLLKVITSSKEIEKTKKQERRTKIPQSTEVLSKLTTFLKGYIGKKTTTKTTKSSRGSTKKTKHIKLAVENRVAKTKPEAKAHLNDNENIQKLLAKILPSVVKSVKASLNRSTEQFTKKPTTKTTTRPTTKPTTTTPKPKMVNLDDVVKNLLPLILKKTAQTQQQKTPPTTKPTTKPTTPKPTTPPKKASALADLLSRFGLSGLNLNNLKGSLKPARDILERPETTKTVQTASTTKKMITTPPHIEAPTQTITARVNQLPRLPERALSPVTQARAIQGNLVNYQNPSNIQNYNQDSNQKYGAQRRILCFGDSLTKGYAGRGRAFHPYSVHLSQLLNSDNRGLHYNVISSGEMREMAHGSMSQRLPMVLGNSSRFDWVIILGGTNDVAHVKNFGDDDSFMGQLVKVWSPRIVKDIETLHETAHRYGARTVLVTIPESAYESWSQFRILLYMRKAINEQLRKYARQSQGQTVLCDMARAIPRLSMSPDMQTKIWSDHLHLTAYGYDLMAQFIYKCMNPFLN